MQILVINCGSSSLNAAVIDPDTGIRSWEGRVERVGTSEAELRLSTGARGLAAPDHAHALSALLNAIPDHQREHIGAAGHRVVHGGEAFVQPTRIDDTVEAEIERLIPLAPLHNPANLAGIRAARRLLPHVPHMAVFDTAFHATLPRRAQRYALPTDVTERYGLRRFGFHGISHQYVAQAASEWMEADIRDLRLISCHLGNGASVCAIEFGRSVETSMGMTPLEGLVMGTRSGDIDPGIVLHLLREGGMSVDEVDDLLQRHSGLAGLSGAGNDLRDIESRASEGDSACQLAIHIYSHRVRKYIGAYAAVMGGVDAILFTAGIGQNSSLMRHRIAQRLDFLGARLDEDRNREARLSRAEPVVDLASPRSRVRVLAVATDEEHMIARCAARLFRDQDRVRRPSTIPIAVSARHVHLSRTTFEALFGQGAELTHRNDLSQPGQFAAEETVDLIGPRRTIERVRILGPLRPEDQVEIARTDEFHLGIDAPVRASGDVANSPGITLGGPLGRVTIPSGVICAWRHIHMTPADAEHFGVADRDVVDVSVGTEGRSLIFGDVLVRVHPSFALEMHIDTDEANAAEISGATEGVLQRRSTRWDGTQTGTSRNA
jgi:acetate kinase